MKDGSVKWEYLFIDAVWDIACGHIPVAANRKKLKFRSEMCVHEYANHLGDDGWELAAATETGNTMRFMFKRPKERPHTEEKH